MTTRRRVRIDVDLPELTPDQADFLWNFLEDLATNLWDAYENELLDLEREAWAVVDDDNLIQNGPPSAVSKDDTDTDF